jgi:hypothetical protein
MKGSKRVLVCFLLCVPTVALLPISGVAQSVSTGTAASQTRERDGQHDFDFSIGTWRTELSRLLNPLTGSDEWVEYKGTSVTRKVWDGRANLLELDIEGPTGRLVGLSLRLYNPQSRQWSLNYANVNGGTMTTPVIGEFRDGRGEFYAQETFNGRAIFVRFVITKITPDSWRYEQSFSDDGGKTWEANWIAVDTLIEGEPGQTY